MSFAYAIFLLGALGAVGPLAAHFFAQPRFKRIPFTMLRFLQLGHQESRHRRRLKDLLLLALRMLIVVTAALAFAGPRLVSTPPPTDAAPFHVIGVDDSLSMAYRHGGSTSIERAKTQVEQYMQQAPAHDRFAVFGLASGMSTGVVEKEKATAFVGGLKPVPADIDLGAWYSAIEKAASAPEEEGVPVNAILASDFTPAALAALDMPRKAAAVQSVEILAVGPENGIRNASIERCVIEVLGEGRYRLLADIANSGDALDGTIAVSNAGETLATGTWAAGAGQRVQAALEVTLDSSVPSIPLTVALGEGDNLPEDDAQYLGVALPERIENRVLLAADTPRDAFLLKTALEVLSGGGYEDFITSDVAPASFDSRMLSAVDAVAFVGAPPALNAHEKAVREFVEGGGRLVLFAPASKAFDALSSWTSAGLSPVAAERFMDEAVHIAAQPAGGAGGDMLDPSGAMLAALKNYGLDAVPLRGYYAITLAPEAQALWFLENGVPFIAAKQLGRGLAICVNTSASDAFGTLMKSPAAPAFSKYLLGHHQPQRVYAFAANEPVTTPATEAETRFAKGEELRWLVLPDGDLAEVTVADGYLIANAPLQLGMAATVNTPVRYAGLNVPAGETDMTPAARGVIDRAAAVLLSTTPGSAGSAHAEVFRDDERALWKYVLWAALGLLLTEAFVANRVKR